MTEETKPQTFAIAITTGTNNPLQTHLAVLNGFTQRKLGNNVCFILQGEAGSVANEEVLRTCNGFGLPPIAKFLDDECMKEVEWIIWEFCANARKQQIFGGDSIKMTKVSAMVGAQRCHDADKVMVF